MSLASRRRSGVFRGRRAGRPLRRGAKSRCLAMRCGGAISTPTRASSAAPFASTAAATRSSASRRRRPAHDHRPALRSLRAADDAGATLTGSAQWLTSRSARPLYLFGRMKPGVSIEQARAEVAGTAAALDQEFPRTVRRGLAATVLPLAQARRGAQSDPRGAAHPARAGCVRPADRLRQPDQPWRCARRRRGSARSRSARARRLVTPTAALLTEVGDLLFVGAAALLLTGWMVDFLRLLVPFVEYSIRRWSCRSGGASRLRGGGVGGVGAAGRPPAGCACRAATSPAALKAGGRQNAGDTRNCRLRGRPSSLGGRPRDGGARQRAAAGAQLRERAPRRSGLRAARRRPRRHQPLDRRLRREKRADLSRRGDAAGALAGVAGVTRRRGRAARLQRRIVERTSRSKATCRRGTRA